MVLGPFATAAVWSVQFDPVSNPGPYTIQAVLEQDKLTLTDVLFGDVWVCSGQSNMVFTINQVSPPNVSQHYSTME